MAPLVALTGFMGSGKTTVGVKVAETLGWRFVDLDESIESVEGRTIEEFFARDGETAFRAMEGETLERLLAADAGEAPLVVALGGGTLESPRAASILRRSGGLVFLDVDPDRAWERVVGTARPLARDKESFVSLLARRRETYENAADWVLPVENRTADQLADEVVAMVRLAGRHWPAMWGRRLSTTERASLVVGGTGSLAVLADSSAAARESGCRLHVITDQNVMRAWGETVASYLGDPAHAGVLVVEPGEGSKSPGTLVRCWDWLAGRGARRDDIVVALGGGVVGDLAGFAAATYQRGVSLWQIPTTVLAQVDSSVGGKTAVDLEAGKNLVGAFYQPDLVIVDPVTLTTLSALDYGAGLGEVVKHALLMSRGALGGLEQAAPSIVARDPDTVGRMVKESLGYKARVVEADERERGRRAVLNLGHTVAHALEVVEGYGSLSHGQAVALGLLAALAVSEELLELNHSVRERTCGLLSLFGFATRIELPSADLLLSAMARDKKARAGTTGFVGLRALGDAVWGMNVTRDALVRALEVIRR